MNKPNLVIILSFVVGIVCLFKYVPANSRHVHAASHPLVEFRRPIAQGQIVSVELLDRPFPQYQNYSYQSNTVKQGSVEIYDHFIIVTSHDGVSRVSPHNSYKNLKFKR